MRTGTRRAASVSIAAAAIALLALIPALGVGAVEKDRYIVVFEDSVEHPANLARAQVQQRSGKLGFVYRVVLNGYSAELPVQAVEGLRRDPRVKYVTVDGEVAPGAQTTPTGISRTFAASNKALDIDSVDDLRVDADIAVIDTGVDYTHPDLNVVARTDCSNGTEKEAKCVDSSGTDTEGHGTHVAGIAGAIDNGFGVVGTAPGARIWAVKVLGTGINYTSELIAGVQWVTAKRQDGDPENDIEVANMSIWCEVSSLCPTKALDEAITKSVEAGVVNVVIAGNAGKDAKNYTPANSPNAITVSSVADYDGKAGGKGSPTCVNKGLDDRLANDSNFGSTVEVAAPGVCIYSTLPGEKYGYDSGTSMAAPYVAGAAAILAARDKPESKADVEAITKTIKNEGNFGWTDTSKDGVQEPLLDVSDEAVFLPGGQFLLRNSNSEGAPDITFVHGLPGDRPIAGDWNKDGTDTIGFYRGGDFYLRNNNSPGSSDMVFSFANPGDLPVAGDWNGDGTDSIGVYRPTTGDFFLRDKNSGGEAEYVFSFANSGDLPVAGDWNGDGVDSVGVYRPSNGNFYLTNSNEAGPPDYAFSYGNPGDLPVAGDWAGEGADRIGLFRPSNHTWYLERYNLSESTPEYVFSYGNSESKPIAGDWDKSTPATATPGIFN